MTAPTDPLAGLTPMERDIMQYLLGYLENRLTCNMCNDLPRSIVDRYSPDEWLEINQRYEMLNSGGKDEYDAQPLHDFCYLFLIAKKMGFEI
jgi:hypothetical protein